MDIEAIKNQLRGLKLNTAAREIDAILANQKKAVHLGWVTDLLERETDARREAALKSRIKGACFPEEKSVAGFDFAFNPSINEEALRRLSTLTFIPQNRIALFLGNTGTGKTHLAISIGMLAVKSGYRVYCSSAKKLQAEILTAKLNNSMSELFKKILSAKL